jgi:excisionase family DNA binding protein
MEVFGRVEAAEPRLLGLERAADYLDITQRSLYRLMERGIINPVRLPGVRRTLFDKHDLDALVESRKSQVASGTTDQAKQVGAEE